MKKSNNQPLISPTYAVGTNMETDDRIFLLTQNYLASRSHSNDIHSRNNRGFCSTSKARSLTSYSYHNDNLLPEKSMPINCPLPNQVCHDEVHDEDLRAIEWRYDQSTKEMYELMMKYRNLRARNPYGLPIYFKQSVMADESHVNGARFIHAPLFSFCNEDHCLKEDALCEIDNDYDNHMMFDLEDIA